MGYIVAHAFVALLFSSAVYQINNANNIETNQRPKI